MKAQQSGNAPEADLYGNLDGRFGCQRGSSYKFLVTSDGKDEDVCEKVSVTIPREPLDFMRRAVEVGLGHARSLAISLPPALQEAVAWNRDPGSFEIYKHRIEFVKFWTNRLRDLREKDGQFLGQAPKHLTKILQGKRLAFWQDMIDHYEYPDKELVKDVINGFPVTGWLPDSQVFPKDFKPPSMDVSTLQSVSRGINERVKSKVLASSASDLSAATWEVTERELHEGRVEIDNGDGKCAAWVMRFGLQQREKVRVNDDFSVAGVNHTTGSQEKLKILGIDDIAALIAYSMGTCSEKCHPTMLGKTMDLKSAYKQFGIRQDGRERIRVATCHPTTASLVLLMVVSQAF